MGSYRLRRGGFTLVELLVVIGVIAALIAIMLPALSSARAQARATQCLSNIRQIDMALTMYAGENKGRYPQNLALTLPGQYWYDSERVGQFIRPGQPWTASGGVTGGPLICPEDENSLRSYAMNIWASSAVDSNIRATFGIRGNLWSSNAANGTGLILVAEKWAGSGSVSTGLLATATLGFAGITPGQRFGVGGGLSPLISAGFYGPVNSELPFMRHRNQGRGIGSEPYGRVSIGYADGHAALASDSDLAQELTGLSSLDSWWSPLDPAINK